MQKSDSSDVCILFLICAGFIGAYVTERSQELHVLEYVRVYAYAYLNILARSTIRACVCIG